MRVTYKNFRQLTPYTRQYWTENFTAISSWQVGGLTYFKLNEFEYRAVDTDMIVEIV